MSIESSKEHDMLGPTLSASEASLQLHQSHVQEPKSKFHEIVFIGVVCSAQLMTQAGLAQSIAPLHIIGQSFGATNPGQLSWFAAGYSLTVGTFILIAGRLGDIYGHKRFFVLGFLWYATWSVLAGFSAYSNQIFFDCCRAFQGIGPAFILPNAIAILGRTYEPGRKKNMVFSLLGATAPGGFVLGATFSSLLGQLLWWPWSYWIMGIACLSLATAGVIVIPHTPSPQRTQSNTFKSAWERVDAPGAITGVIGLILFNFAWNQGPVVGWQTPYTYALLIVGSIFLCAFFYLESRAPFPLLPVAVLTKDTCFMLGCVAAGWSSFGIWIYYVWQFMTVLREQTPLLSSAQFVPVALSGLCAAITTGFLLSHLPPSAVMLAAMTAFTVGGICIATAPVQQTYWAQTFVSLIVMPWGMDMSFPAATIILSNTMPKEHQGLAASLVNTVVNYSISIGLGFAGTIESQINDGGANVLKGYRGSWYMAIGLSGLGIAVAVTYAGYTYTRGRQSAGESLTKA
ncbi:LAMI_0C11034g1_1 [Lachancea mirantina]|uniref:LAMI_0C11034g1_1 n=1 Tax=Lachancea mirantina TaxID=1230905 RepID=A0A1G4J702_9SACH|nr:LAMI_0C11034g1_1 [Lachancea mirantina]